MTSPPFSLTALRPEAAVGARSRQDHADRARPIFLRQGAQQEVERQTRAVTALAVARGAGRPRRRIDRSRAE